MSKPFASTCYKAWFLVIAACVALLEPALAQNNPTQTAPLRWYGDINGSSFAAGKIRSPSLSTAPAFGSQVTTDSK